ncbi:MAG: nucleotidyltransferase domain-containing protein [Victivallales bacterium]|nr:nucleotidyltransferase domain-containing protein [Victivallales bacterium]
MLEKLINSQAKTVILTRLFTPDTPRFHLRQLARDGGLSAPGLLKELTHFHELKLVCKEEANGCTDYYADSHSVLFPALCELVDKAEGLHGKIRRMLSPLNTVCIFIYGSEANSTARPDSDIDLFVIGKCTLMDISRALLPAADLTDREINPYLLTPADFRSKCQIKDHFVQSVLQSPMLFLKGGKHELERLAG